MAGNILAAGNAFSAGTMSARPNLENKNHPAFRFVFFICLILTAGYVFHSIMRDVAASDAASSVARLPYILLGAALLTALGFEFVNGFHDTANAVATVIYTHSLPPSLAVIWSGTFNFLGVLVSSGAVAFSIISLLPVELILQVGSSAGFAMVFSLLIAAIIWNLGTWWLGLPASSSHTLIGSIIGVGVANALMKGHDGTSGVDWSQAAKVGYSLLLSPMLGFLCAALVLLALRALLKKTELYEEPKGNTPPPWWIRGILILTCTGVSFAHGSNDGQKGMGLIMLILIGTVPTAYALNHAVPDESVDGFLIAARETRRFAPGTPSGNPNDVLTEYIKTKAVNAHVLPALGTVIDSVALQIQESGSLSKLAREKTANVRNDMYLADEAIRFLLRDSNIALSSEAQEHFRVFKTYLDSSTKFIPLWVKIAVAVALGLGTMVGWKRIVVTVGEKIGKTHLTYAQGASAELVAMTTIGAADIFGLPVSTTHVLSSGIAGTMAAERSGLQWSTVKNIAMGWVLTLPISICLSGTLYWLLSNGFSALSPAFF
ncbi:MAG: inorganic phosphate transporter [Desulfovibrio sp.]|jgi:PiT family inorganic phosphate transporter|nr:inorganic phosphate transporter [Desulfovibrio sp.]